MITYIVLTKRFNFIFLLLFNFIRKMFSHEASILNMSFTSNILLRATIVYNTTAA